MSNANIQNITAEDLKPLFLKETAFIDVRAPVEFKQGSLPGAVNLPIINDEERALIGTLYKKEGQEAAVRLGHQLVSGSLKQERLEAWQNFILKNPETVLYCFRGGKRSQITQQWLREIGIDRPLIVGGYKKSRLFLSETLTAFSQNHQLLPLTGPTGSGKTRFLKEIHSLYPTIDLEHLAQHRGSAFGQMTTPQPSQVDFENRLSVELIKTESINVKGAKILIEDESRLIGRICIPDSFFNELRSSSVLWLIVPFEERVENIFQEYILETAIGAANLIRSQNMSLGGDLSEQPNSMNLALEVFAKYKKSILAIQKKLGGLRTQEILSDLLAAEKVFLEANELQGNKNWIEKLLKYYYDPLYANSLTARNVKIDFKGTHDEMRAYLIEKGE